MKTPFDNEKKAHCLIISTGRAASTAIYKYINEAAKLNLPKNKEPHFWCDVYNFEGLYEGLKKIYVNNKDEYYKAYMNSQMIVDASVGYFFCIDKVIEKLRKLSVKPKVIFLYREPVSRAESLYNELKKKGLTNSDNVIEDIELFRPNGLWWERYYDNVYYYDNFKAIESYFNDILLINYDFFAKKPDLGVRIILSFLGLEKKVNIDLCPVNSSMGNKLSQLKIIKLLKKSVLPFIPENSLSFLKKKVLLLPIYKKKMDNKIVDYLQVSIKQYVIFRNYIDNKDCFVFLKS